MIFIQLDSSTISFILLLCLLFFQSSQYTLLNSKQIVGWFKKVARNISDNFEKKKQEL